LDLLWTQVQVFILDLQQLTGLVIVSPYLPIGFTSFGQKTLGRMTFRLYTLYKRPVNRCLYVLKLLAKCLSGIWLLAECHVTFQKQPNDGRDSAYSEYQEIKGCVTVSNNQ
jgi:hypothetical protein